MSRKRLSSSNDDNQSKSEDEDGKRKRKSKAQIKVLEQELFKNPHWTNEDVERISKKSGLKEAQVYKWNWDQKKKLNIIPNKVYVLQMPSQQME